MSDLIRDLGRSKLKAEILTSRLKEWDLLDNSCQVTASRNRDLTFSQYFLLEENLCFCHDMHGLFSAIGIHCVASEWRLFIDSSSRSLKAVLLHNGNKLPSTPIAHSVHHKENYKNVKRLLKSVQYNDFEWEVIGDFKMIAFLVVLQGGNTKFPCYLCLWDSRDTSSHYKKKDWPRREQHDIGIHNVKFRRLVQTEKILMPPLHIKLGLMKQFVAALDSTSNSFKILQRTFPKLSEAKVKAGVFVGPDIRKLMANDEEFRNSLNEVEQAAWDSFKDISKNFLGNQKSASYETIVANMVRNYEAIGCRMSLKLHMLDSHLENFRQNLGSYSEEQGERFHQDVMKFEQRY